MGTKLKMLWIGMALVFALVLTLGLSAFVFALPNESFNLSGELSYEGGPQVVKYYWSEFVPGGGTADDLVSQNLKLFDDGTLQYEMEMTMGSRTNGMTMGATYTKGEIAYLFQPTSLYGYMAVDGKISEEYKWNEEDGENEVYEQVESLMEEFQIYEHVAHYNDLGWFFEDGYVPSETDQPLSGFFANGMAGRSHYFTGLTGTETLGEIRARFDERVTFALDKTYPDYQNMPEVVHAYRSIQILKLDGQDATDDMVVSLGYHTAEVSCEYNGQTYTMLVDFVTTN